MSVERTGLRNVMDNFSDILSNIESATEKHSA